MTPDQPGLPVHIRPLQHPSAAGVAKLMAAWDGLSTERKIAIVEELHKLPRKFLFLKPLLLKALDNDNAYLRHLSAEICREIIDDNEIDNNLRNNNSFLSLENQIDGRWSFHLDSEVSDPKIYWKLERPFRLAYARKNNIDEDIIAIVYYAIENLVPIGEVTETDIFEVLWEYVNNKTDHPQHRHEDGGGEFVSDLGAKELWELIPRLPSSISTPFVESLPVGGLSEALLEEFNDRDLVALLRREEVEFTAFRKKIFFSRTAPHDEVRAAARSRHFHLTDSEFSEVLGLREPARTDLLKSLASARGKLSPYMYAAIADLLRGLGLDQAAEEAERAMKAQLETTPRGLDSQIIRDVALYRLASIAAGIAPLKDRKQPDGDLAFLAGHTLDGDGWGSFLAYRTAWVWPSKRQYNAELFATLPTFDFIDSWFSPEEDGAVESQAEMMRRIAKELYLQRIFTRRIEIALSFFILLNFIMIIISYYFGFHH